jgi:aspartyl aminopeptidase
MQITPEHQQHAQDLLDFIDASPSPWHAVATLEQRLRVDGYTRLDERKLWRLSSGDRHYVIRGDSSLIAFQVGEKATANSGFRIIGAHTDSPGLRLKPKAAYGSEQLTRLGVEPYGGPILATFTDRDLSLAGQLHLRGKDGVESRLIRFEQALARLPNLAIHMNRKVNDEGLKLNKQTELPLILGQLQNELPPAQQFRALRAKQAVCPAGNILSFEFNVYDTQKGAFWGAAGEFLADSQIDNLSSCHAGLCALLDAKPAPHTSVCAFFDHEEIGSESHKGADGSFLSDILERITQSRGEERSEYQRGLAHSLMISADAAHAFHPNFPNAYESCHAIRLNQGPAVKINSNQRYATDGFTEAWFAELCRQAGVPSQTYVHRSDLGCGSTIGPMSAARLGMRTMDCGAPMWAMHSARESAGVMDQLSLARMLTTHLENTARF